MTEQKIDNLPPCPDRPSDAHKGTFGTVIVVGGCATMMGAPALVASAALRSGAGLAKIATVAQAIPTVLALEPCATAIERSEDSGAQLAELRKADRDEKAVLAVGPGLGRDESASDLVLAVLPTGRPMVLDADGLNCLSDSLPTDCLPREAPLIVTPHPGEFRRLAKAVGIAADISSQKGRIAGAIALSKVFGCVVLLKGQSTIVTDGTKIRVNQTGNPAMATGGSGDVLTGMIAGLLAQGMTAFDAASLGAHLHGSAGDLWRDAFGPSGMTARDLLPRIAPAFAQHRRSFSGGSDGPQT